MYEHGLEVRNRPGTWNGATDYLSTVVHFGLLAIWNVEGGDLVDMVGFVHPTTENPVLET